MSHPVLEEIARRAGGRPIYLASAPSVAPWVSDEMGELLRRRRPDLTIVNARGLYRRKDAWSARWPKECDRYAGMIVLTVAEPLAEDEPMTGAGISGAHILGQHGTQELTDLVKLRRPVAWLPCLGGQRRLVSRFSLELATWFATGRWARLFKCADAEPFVPVLGNLSPFVRVRI
jgi:hypothetical protein